MIKTNTTRKMAHDLQVGDIISTLNGRFVVTAPVRPGFYGRGVQITTVRVDRLARPDNTHTNPDIYFVNVEV